MRLQACAAFLLVLCACAMSAPHAGVGAPRSPRVVNLERAAGLPWKDEGRCVVREASQPWPVLAERCFYALDQDRVRFNDRTGRCAVASAGTAVLGVGLCLLAAPEIIVGTVIVVGVVVVGVVIKEALEAYELEPTPQTKPVLRKPSANRKPEPAGQDGFPPGPTEPAERERRPECEPTPVPHAGEDVPHDKCADVFPPNRYPGMDVLVRGVRFDALQVGVRVLWEIKTHRFDTYNEFVQGQEIEREMQQLRREKDAADACGYDFVVGVSTSEHKWALLDRDPELKVVVTGCPR
ncbi:DUF6310 domain-containing protein [Myxococcus fulvus]|nr:DUF6310 domain-containing protein [Myxococcus fulvus]